MNKSTGRGAFVHELTSPNHLGAMANKDIIAPPLAVTKLDNGRLLSNEERQFHKWLMDMGAQQRILWQSYEPISIRLSPERHAYDSTHLLREHVYTPDFIFAIVLPTELPLLFLPSGDTSYPKANKSKSLRAHICQDMNPVFRHMLFKACPELEDHVEGLRSDQVAFVFVDTKGTYSRYGNSSNQEFSINRKWVYQKYGLFINKVIPKTFFKYVNYDHTKKGKANTGGEEQSRKSFTRQTVSPTRKKNSRTT